MGFRFGDYLECLVDVCWSRDDAKSIIFVASLACGACRGSDNNTKNEICVQMQYLME